MNPEREIKYLLLLACWCMSWAAQGATMLGPWIPIFKGIEHSVSTNIPGTGASFQNRQVVNALRVDLSDPDIRLLTSPRYSAYVARDREVGGQTVSDFLKTNSLQVAINANFFESQGYYVPANTPMDVFGVAVSQGVVVSAQDNANFGAALMFNKANQGSIVYTNWPAMDLTGIWTALSGTPLLVMKGTNLPATHPNLSLYDRTTNPRTAFGLSQDKRYLYVVAIDGRQSGYSTGSTDVETAGWMLLLGAYEAINVDGGGSTTLVMADSTGKPVRLNKSSAVADSGRERTVGSHFGIYAKPLPGFINDVVVAADNTAAKITWTTTVPATTQVKYGTTTNLSNTTALLTNLVSDHAIDLGNLALKTEYYFQILATRGALQYVSPLMSFTTSNFVTTNLVFDLTQPWKYFGGTLSSANWTGRSFDDSNWGGPGPGLLWADVRSSGINALVQPKNTMMTPDLSTGYPFVTYYFRTRFQVTEAANSALSFAGLVDDGAIFYLNGVEIHRLRMPGGVVSSSTIATAYPCEGDATCLDEFEIPASVLKSILTSGENALAVEVHNYNVRSADVTFGLSLTQAVPEARSFTLDIQRAGSGGLPTLTWGGTGLILQSAVAVTGPWTDQTGASSPFTVSPGTGTRYFRLRR